MKKKHLIIILSVIIVGTTLFFKLSNKKVIVETKVFPQKKDIQNKLFVSGLLYPLKEVNVKPSLSGIIKKLYVQVGEKVHIGDPIAQIQIIASPITIENAEKTLKIAEVNFSISEAKYNRNKNLFNTQSGLITQQDFEQIEKEYQIAKNDLQSAKRQYEIAQNGFLNNTGNGINIVRATIQGTILDLPIKEGSSVIERNNFNEGTTIATIGDMSTIIFKGKVPEQNLFYLKPNMPLEIKIGALNDKKINASLKRIHPKSIVESGITKFEIEGQVSASQEDIKDIRSGMTSIATIILQETKQTISIEEKYLFFNGDTSFVWIKKNNTQKQKTPVKIGISDGIFIEIKEGLNLTDEIKLNDL